VVFSSVNRPSESRGFIHKKIGRLARKVGGFVPGIGGVIQTFGGILEGGPATDIARPTRFTPQISPVQATQCPAGYVWRNGACRRGSVTPVVLPPTPTITTPAEGDFQAVQGAFGLAAMAPKAETRVHLDCPKGMVLGEDNLCYPKQVLRRNSQFRKWRSGARPPISAADAKMFRRLDAARKKVAEFAKVADLRVTRKK